MAASFTLYTRPRLLAVICLGFASGLPLALTGETLKIWLTEQHISLASIGAFSLATLAYSLKFFWAPLLDQLAIPFLTARMGRRRSWALLIQLGLIAVILGLGSSDPGSALNITALWAVALAFLSASQDIVIDAFRVELLTEEEQGAGAGAATLGYRLGMIASGAGALITADAFGWRSAFLLMAGLVSIGMATILLLPEPTSIRPNRFSFLATSSLGAPFLDFARREGWVVILLFVALYYLSDAMSGAFSGPFYLSLGFTKTEIGSISKVLGVCATIVGTLAGGILTARLGILRALMMLGILKTGTNLLYLVQLASGHNLLALTATIGTENLATGAAASAFIAFISQLCSREHTATQYALLSAIAAVPRTTLPFFGGLLAQNLGWGPFFVASTVLALPGLLLLLWMMKGRTSVATAG